MKMYALIMLQQQWCFLLLIPYPSWDYADYHPLIDGCM